MHHAWIRDRSADTAIWIPTNLLNLQILIYPLVQVIRRPPNYAGQEEIIWYKRQLPSIYWYFILQSNTWLQKHSHCLVFRAYSILPFYYHFIMWHYQFTIKLILIIKKKIEKMFCCDSKHLGLIEKSILWKCLTFQGGNRTFTSVHKMISIVYFTSRFPIIIYFR
jgi:hypothetical protein